MIQKIFSFPNSFVSKKRAMHIPVTLVADKQYKTWLSKQSATVKAQAKEEGFGPKGSQILVVRDTKGKAREVFGGVHDGVRFYDVSAVAGAISKTFSEEALKSTSFELKGTGLSEEALNRAHIGWALAAYKFDIYKKRSTAPALLWSAKADKKRVKAFVESILALKNMVNTPANDLGTEEMEEVASKIAGDFSAKIKVVKDKQLLTQNYPLIYAVGDSSPRRPRLIELRWGSSKHKKLTIIGKGVVFDTGGLDLKPSKFMELMKKDMGGAAHALAVAQMIMALKLPVNLRVLLPVVENSVSGSSFRPGDAMPSRKGLIVENKCTDAEGRLILADAITAASEESPDLIITFATLTGSARAGLGPDIPAMFSNNDKIGADLQKISMQEEDPLWQMPLWQDYQAMIKSSVGDLVNSSNTPGDLIYSALFLEHFLVKKPNWIHIDCYAWESRGKPGRPTGAADTGVRSVFAFLEKRYGR